MQNLIFIIIVSTTPCCISTDKLVAFIPKREQITCTICYIAWLHSLVIQNVLYCYIEFQRRAGYFCPRENLKLFKAANIYNGRDLF